MKLNMKIKQYENKLGPLEVSFFQGHTIKELQSKNRKEKAVLIQTFIKEG